MVDFDGSKEFMYDGFPKEFQVRQNGKTYPYYKLANNKIRFTNEVPAAGGLDIVEVMTKQPVHRPTLAHTIADLAFMTKDDVKRIDDTAARLKEQSDHIDETLKVSQGLMEDITAYENENKASIEALKADTEQGLVGLAQGINNTNAKIDIINTRTISDAESLGTKISDHERANNPHKITKKTLGIEKVDNTADIDKPVSKAVKKELDKKADKAALAEITAELEKQSKKQEDIVNGLSSFGAAYAENGGGTGGASSFSELKGSPYDNSSLASALNSKQNKITSSSKLSADLVNDSESTNKFVTTEDITSWNGKQDALVSGENIKTINNTSILGSGNIDISSDAYDSLTEAQKATLLSTGTYEGKVVASGTIFTYQDGTFQKFTKEQVVSDTAFVSTGHTMPYGTSYYVTKNSNGLYMAIPIDMADYCYTSTDGENWTATLGVAAIPTAIHSGALYKNGVWVICNSNASSMAYSEDDGDTWETAYSATFFPDKSFVLEGGYFIICDGNNEPCYSADGKTWTQMSSGMTEVYGITYDGTQWIAVTYGHKIYTNSDITDDNGWTEVTPTTAPVSNSFYSVAYSNGTYYIYGVAYLNGAWVEIVETSTDLLNWTHSDKLFPDNNGWQGGYSRFICNGAFVGLEINASLWYTTNGGADWSDEISSNGHSTLVGGDLWDVTSGAISTFDATTELGNVIRGISYSKAEVDTLLGGKQKTIGGGSNISVDQSGATAYVSFYPSTTTEPPTSGTWGNTGTLLTDTVNHKAYINVGYDELWQPIWKNVQTDTALIDIAEAGDGIKFTVGSSTIKQNFTIVGSPTITSGVASNFSKNNYLKANYHFDASSKPWKFSFKFTPTHVSGHDSIIGGEWNTLNESFMLIRLVSGKMLIMMTDLNNTTFINNTGTYSFTNNNTYYAEVGYDGTKYYSKYRQSGSDTWTDDMNITSSSLLNDGYFVIGTLLYSGSGSGGEYFHGSIDLNEFSVEIDNEVVWTPYSEEYSNKTKISSNINLTDIAETGTGIILEGGTPTQNFTIAGSPTIIDGIASGFSSSAYLTSKIKFTPGDDTWEYGVEFTTGSISEAQGVIGCLGTSDSCTPFYIDSPGKLICYLSSNGVSWDIANASEIMSLSANTTYKMKAEFTGTEYNWYLYENDSWTLKHTISSTSKVFGGLYPIIGNNRGSNNPFRGSVNLNECYIKINGFIWWTPYSVSSKAAITLDISTDQANAPTSSTAGYVGKLYITSGGAVYICTGVSGSTYTWSQITVS